MCQDEIKANGWTSMPANAGAIFKDQSFIEKAVSMDLDTVKFPYNNAVVAKTLEYARAVLHPETLNHSMRVYYYGMVVSKQQFPEQATALDRVTWALTCLLHDLALYVLKGFGATTDQAEAAAEAIIRHEDMGVDGSITYFGQLIQLATTYDNTGFHPHVKGFENLIHDTTRRLINEAHPRLKWCTFFSNVIRKEETIKPWCHSTHLVNFDHEIEANTLMKQWE
ncbi:cyanamide hydratase [Aspergillus granulosus]|uniref:Cyanamide hydratase n=1 Tax=Aspergillus granulosus TaxID=176169 RepID=A0ABR4GS02_9EURO